MNSMMLMKRTLIAQVEPSLAVNINFNTNKTIICKICRHKKMINLINCVFLVAYRDPKRGGGGDSGSVTPLKNQKAIDLLSNTGLDPLKVTSIQCWAKIYPPTKHHLNGILLAGQ